jgi:hypothetical protein
MVKILTVTLVGHWSSVDTSKLIDWIVEALPRLKVSKTKKMPPQVEQ